MKTKHWLAAALVAAAWTTATAQGLSRSTADAVEGAAPPSLAAAATPLELNAASRPELEALPGVGVDMAARILEARAQRPFDGWADLMRRVSGLKQKRADRLAEHGVVVNGQQRVRVAAPAANGAAGAASQAAR